MIFRLVALGIHNPIICGRVRFISTGLVNELRNFLWLLIEVLSCERYRIIRVLIYFYAYGAEEDMSESEDIPLNRETYEKLTKDFATITGTNEALAQTFLQDYKWNLEKSVSAFYDALNEETKKITKKSKNVVNVDFSGLGQPSGSRRPDDLYDPITGTGKYKTVL